MAKIRRQYLGIAFMAMTVSTAFVYLHATRPSAELPLNLTVFRYPGDLFGVREESPSMTLSLVCQQPISILDIRFISSVEYLGLPDLIGAQIKDPDDLLVRPPLSNLSELFVGHGITPRTLTETIKIDEETLTMRTFDFDSSAGGIIESGAFLVYDFLFNQSDHLITTCRGMEDFFVIAGETLTYLAIEHNDDILEFFSEEREGGLKLRDRPKGGLARFEDLSAGDVISITMRWRPNIKGASEEVKKILSGSFFIERIEVIADGRPVDLGLKALVIDNLR